MSQTKAQLLDNIKDNVQLDARNSLRFADTDSSHYVAFKAPATVSSNVTWTLPAADGAANYVLATDGSGNLSWIADPAGQWTTSGSNIYFTGGNVGIGDTSPSNPLSVTGASAFNGDVTLTGASYNVTWDKSADDLIFADNAKAAFGTSSDMTLWHDGSHSHLQHENVGNLYVLCKSGQINFETATEVMAQMIPDGSVKLFHNGVQKFETNSAGIWVSGNIAAGDNSELQLGTGGDMILRHNGSNSFIENSTGNLILRPKTDEEGLILRADGAAELFYNNSKKIETTNIGCDISLVNAGDGLRLYSSGNIWGKVSADVNRTNTSGGMLSLQGLWNGTQVNIIELQTGDDTTNKDDGRLAFYTRESGSAIRNNFKIEPDGSIEIPNDSQKLKVGAGSDLELFHDGTQSIIQTNSSATKPLHIKGDPIHFYKTGGSEVFCKMVADGAVELYHDNDLRFYTTTYGTVLRGKEGYQAEVHIYGDEGDDNADKWQLHVGDAGFNILNYTSGSWETSLECHGDGAVDLYYNNTSHMKTTGEGIDVHNVDDAVLTITTTGTDAHDDARLEFITQESTFKIQNDRSLGTDGALTIKAESEDCIYMYKDGAVELYYDNAKRFQTQSNGVGLFGLADSAGNSDLRYNSTNGTVSYDSSTRLVKKNIIDCSYGLDIVNQLKPRKYIRKDAANTEEIGFIADEVVSLIPEIVPIGPKSLITKNAADTEEIPLNVDYRKMCVVLTKAIQELSAKVAALESA